MVALRSVEAGDLTIAYRRAGGGDPLTLLHGAMGHSAEWWPQLEGLSKRFDVIAWDAPGCGGSDDPSAGATLDDYADHLISFMDALGLRWAHVGGLSWGGGLALCTATRHPRRVRGMILMSAYAGWAGSLGPEEVERRLARALADAERPPAEVAGEWLGELVGEGAPDGAGRELARIIGEFRPGGVRAMASAFAEADLRPRLAEVASPTLVIAGDRDVRAPLRVAEELHRSIPGARLAVVPGAGHMVGAEAPGAVNDQIATFLASIDP